MSEKASVQTRARRERRGLERSGQLLDEPCLLCSGLGPGVGLRWVRLVYQRPVWLSACVLFDCGVATVSDGELDGYLSSEKAGRPQLALSSASWCE